MKNIVCRYCGGNCPNEEENSLYLCDGYAGDIDGLYAKESDSKQRFTGQTEKFEQSFNEIFISGESDD